MTLRRWFTWPKVIFYVLCGLLWAAWYVPRLSAAKYREPIRQALENALGRKVEVGLVQFRLLPVPGFTISNVIVGEDPAVGPEPVAYITTMRARPRISALFGGPLGFASVDLEDTSVNLTRVEAANPSSENGVRWNFTSLMRPKLLATFPSVHMISGRVNFKFGDTKSVLYLLDTDVDLWPPDSDGGPWTLRVRAEPARTDRPSHGFGSFVARGQWFPKDGNVAVDVKLEKSELGDMITLFEGQESGLHGDIQGSAHLAGPVSRVGIAGKVAIDDVHAWNQTPPGGRPWTLAVSGAIDLSGQVVEVRATTGEKQSPVDFRYRVADYLGHPRWGITAGFNQLPISPLFDLARNFGLGIPAEMSLQGAAQGAISFSMPGGTPRFDGQVRIADPSLQLKGSPTLRSQGADARFSGSLIQFGPAVWTADSAAGGGIEALTMTAAYDVASGRLEALFRSDAMAVATVRRELTVARVPVLSQATGGTWGGRLRYSNVPAPAWSGDLHLADADVPFEAFAEPLHVAAADGTLDSAGLNLRRVLVSAGGIEAQGDYRYLIGDPHPHRFRFTVARAEGGALEKLLAPTLHRGNFLSYAFNFGRVPEPDWMKNMGADGSFQIGTLDLGGSVFSKVRGRLTWEGDQAKFTAVQAQLGAAAFTGTLASDLSQRDPRYQIEGKIAGLAWKSGAVEASGVLSTLGSGSDLLAKLKASGTFRARHIDLTPTGVFESVEGGFDWVGDSRNPRVKLPNLTMVREGATFHGSAESGDGGRVTLRVTDGAKRIEAAGALLRGEELKPVVQ